MDTGVQGDTGGYGEYKGVLRETVGYWRLLMDTLQYARTYPSTSNKWFCRELKGSHMGIS